MASDMRIAVMGQQAFGGKVVEALVEKGYAVSAILLAPDKEGRPIDPIKSAALAHDIPVLQFGRLRDREAIDAFKELNVDLGVMAFVTDIVPLDILTAPVHGTIQYHPSLLPKYRGPSSINWPIIQGETKTGLTIFWPDDGLDTGPILLQKEVAIEPDDTLGSLYFDKLFPMGVEAMVEAVEMAAQDTAPKIVQNDSESTYQSWCRAKDVVIDWERPISEIYNTIRGSDPSPGAGTTFAGKPLQLYKASREDGPAAGAPGEVTKVTDEGFAVAADEGTLFIRRVQPENSGKIPAPEWAASANLQPGAILGA